MRQSRGQVAASLPGIQKTMKRKARAAKEGAKRFGKDEKPINRKGSGLLKVRDHPLLIMRCAMRDLKSNEKKGQKLNEPVWDADEDKVYSANPSLNVSYRE